MGNRAAIFGSRDSSDRLGASWMVSGIGYITLFAGRHPHNTSLSIGGPPPTAALALGARCAAVQIDSEGKAIGRSVCGPSRVEPARRIVSTHQQLRCDLFFCGAAWGGRGSSCFYPYPARAPGTA